MADVAAGLAIFASVNQEINFNLAAVGSLFHGKSGLAENLPHQAIVDLGYGPEAFEILTHGQQSEPFQEQCTQSLALGSSSHSKGNLGAVDPWAWYEPVATTFCAPSRPRITNKERPALGSECSQRRRMTSALGSACDRNRRHRDSGERLWKNSSRSGASAGTAARTWTVLPSRRVKKSASSPRQALMISLAIESDIMGNFPMIQNRAVHRLLHPNHISR